MNPDFILVIEIFCAFRRILHTAVQEPPASCHFMKSFQEGGLFVHHTANYSLSQWESTDRILMEDFNADNAKLDAALTAQAAAIALCGNCQLYHLEYQGAGAGYRDNPKTVAFPHKPLFVSINNNGFHFSIPYGALAYRAEKTTYFFTWTENSLTWYSSSTDSLYGMDSVNSTVYLTALLDLTE